MTLTPNATNSFAKTHWITSSLIWASPKSIWCALGPLASRQQRHVSYRLRHRHHRLRSVLYYTQILILHILTTTTTPRNAQLWHPAKVSAYGFPLTIFLLQMHKENYRETFQTKQRLARASNRAIRTMCRNLCPESKYRHLKTVPSVGTCLTYRIPNSSCPLYLCSLSWS